MVVTCLTFSDLSVLENHHIAAAFLLLEKELMTSTPMTMNSPPNPNKDVNILNQFTKQEWKTLRSLMISLVLATDMTKHFNDLGMFKSRLNCDNFNPKENDKAITMNILMHISDISNPAKNWDICFKWTNLLFVEFFNQGDKEKDLDLPIS
jgi:hypothetical protein